MLDIVIPVYNEGENIVSTLREIEQKIHAEKRVLIVYDFDEDNTLPAVEAVRGDFPFDIVLEKNNIGRGALNAIKAGFAASTAPMVLVAMADLSDDLIVVDTMCAMMEAGADVVCGSRYMKGGKQIGSPFLKGLFSRLAGISLHWFTRIPTHDVTNSFKLYSRRLLDTFTVESTGGFELGMELTVKAYTHGMKVTETPSTWTDRVAGESRFKMWEWIPRYLHWYFFCIRDTWFR